MMEFVEQKMTKLTKFSQKLLQKEERKLGSREEELIISATEVPYDVCCNDELIYQTLTEAAQLMGMKIRASASYRCGANSPPGAICFVMVDQSFVYTHTFADINRMTIRVFTCGESNPMVGWNYIKKRLGITKFTIKQELLE